MNALHVAPWVAATALVALAACGHGDAPGPFPQAVADSWTGAFNSGDVDGLALMYSDDAQVLPPDEPIVAGHEDIQAFWASYRPGQVRIEVTAANSEMLGPYWFREGSYKALFPDEGEPRVGKFLELWKKVDSNWLIYRHMWSRNSPPPEAMPEPAPAA